MTGRGEPLILNRLNQPLKMLSRVKIVSPLSDEVPPLERVSDSVLAQRILGMGVERFKSTIRLQYGNKKATARGMTAIVSLQVPYAAKVQVLASGDDAKAAGEQLEELLAQGCGDAGHVPASAPAMTTISPTAAPASHFNSVRSEKAPSGSKVIP